MPEGGNNGKQKLDVSDAGRSAAIAYSRSQGLTGESAAVDKRARAMEPTGQLPSPGDRENMAYLGSAVVHGRGQACLQSSRIRCRT